MICVDALDHRSTRDGPRARASAATALTPSLSCNANGCVRVRLKHAKVEPAERVVGDDHRRHAVRRACTAPSSAREPVVCDEDRVRGRARCVPTSCRVARSNCRPSSPWRPLETHSLGCSRTYGVDGQLPARRRRSSTPRSTGVERIDGLRRSRRSSTGRRCVRTAPTTMLTTASLVASSSATRAVGLERWRSAERQHDGDAERSELVAHRKPHHVREELLDRRATVEQRDRHREHALADAHGRALRDLPASCSAGRASRRTRRRCRTGRVSPGRSVGLPTVGRRFRPCSDAWKSVRVGHAPVDVDSDGCAARRAGDAKPDGQVGIGFHDGRLADQAEDVGARVLRAGHAVRRVCGRRTTGARQDADGRRQQRPSDRPSHARTVCSTARPPGWRWKPSRSYSRNASVLRSCVLTIARAAPRRFIHRRPSSTERAAAARGAARRDRRQAVAGTRGPPPVPIPRTRSRPPDRRRLGTGSTASRRSPRRARRGRAARRGRTSGRRLRAPRARSPRRARRIVTLARPPHSDHRARRARARADGAALSP